MVTSKITKNESLRRNGDWAPVYYLLGTHGPLHSEAALLAEAVLRIHHPQLKLCALEAGKAALPECGEGEAVLATAYFPDTAILHAAALPDHKCVLVVDEGTEAVGASMRSAEDFGPALRAASSAYATLVGADQGDARVHSSHWQASFEEAARTLARHFDVVLDEDAVDMVLSFYLGAEKARGLSTQRTWRDLADLRQGDGASALWQLSKRNRDIVVDVIEPCRALLMGEGCAPIVWPRALFCPGDYPDTALGQDVELAGAARCIVYGPYLHLPPGAWQVQIICGFSRESVGTPFAMELKSARAATLLDKTAVRPNRAGYFIAQLQIRVEDPADPLELIISTLSGAISGRISLRMVVLSRADTPWPQFHLGGDGMPALSDGSMARCRKNV